MRVCSTALKQADLEIAEAAGACTCMSHAEAWPRTASSWKPEMRCKSPAKRRLHLERGRDAEVLMFDLPGGDA